MPDTELVIKLTDDHIKALRDGESKLDKVEPFLQRLENCGINCDDRRNTVATLREFFGGLRKEFLPDLVEN